MKHYYIVKTLDEAGVCIEHTLYITVDIELHWTAEDVFNKLNEKVSDELRLSYGKEKRLFSFLTL